MKTRVMSYTHTELDRFYIDLALILAVRGEGQVKPNPLVGAAVVKDVKIVGQGFHIYDQIKHAEVLAFEQAGSLAVGATVYVNLEPCCHRGRGKRNRPCVDALIAARVKRVVCCISDPNPRVSGRGFDALRNAGIEISVGLRASLFFKFHPKRIGLAFHRMLRRAVAALNRNRAIRQNAANINKRTAVSAQMFGGHKTNTEGRLECRVSAEPVELSTECSRR